MKDSLDTNEIVLIRRLGSTPVPNPDEAEQLASDALRKAIRKRSSSETRTRLLRTVVGVAATLIVAGSGFAAAQGDWYESTRHLVGDELADALELNTLTLESETFRPPSSGPEAGCGSDDRPGSVIVEVFDPGDGQVTAYCVDAGSDSIEDQLQAWETARRLQNRPPSDLEIEIMRLQIRGNKLDEAGRHAEAERVWNQAADLIDDLHEERGPTGPGLTPSPTMSP